MVLLLLVVDGAIRGRRLAGAELQQDVQPVGLGQEPGAIRCRSAIRALRTRPRRPSNPAPPSTGSSSSRILLANSPRRSGTGESPFARYPILPRLRPVGRPREFASSHL